MRKLTTILSIMLLVLATGLGFAGTGCRSGQDGKPSVQGSEYFCPMHPDVRQAVPGKCPDCGMDLVQEGHEDEH